MVGDIPVRVDSWRQVAIRDVSVGVFDGPHATPRKTGDGPVFLGISSLQNGRIDLSFIEHLSEADFAKWTRRVAPQPDDIVFSYETRLGEAAMIPTGLRCCLGRRMALIRPDQSRIAPRFLLYSFLSPRFQDVIRERTVRGSTVDRIPLIEFPGFPLLLPPLEEQKAIAHVLGALDDKIELNRRMNETLEQIASAIFKSWFVDFDPVRAKSEGRQPPGLDPETAALFPDTLTDSPIGPIPKGWTVVPLSSAFELNPPRTLGKNAVAPYLDMANMPTTSARPLEWINRTFTSGTKFANGDVLVARITPCLENGKTAFVDFLENGQVGWGSTEFIVMRSKSPLPVEYAYCLARTDEFREHAIVNMTGSSGRQRVPTSCFDRFFVCVPTKPIADRFGRIAGPVLQTVKHFDEESRTLAAIRDALLPKLLSGEIRIKDAEKVAEEVA